MRKLLFKHVLLLLPIIITLSGLSVLTELISESMKMRKAVHTAAVQASRQFMDNYTRNAVPDSLFFTDLHNYLEDYPGVQSKLYVKGSTELSEFMHSQGSPVMHDICNYKDTVIDISDDSGIYSLLIVDGEYIIHTSVTEDSFSSTYFDIDHLLRILYGFMLAIIIANILTYIIKTRK